MTIPGFSGIGRNPSEARESMPPAGVVGQRLASLGVAVSGVAWFSLKNAKKNTETELDIIRIMSDSWCFDDSLFISGALIFSAKAAFIQFPVVHGNNIRHQMMLKSKHHYIIMAEIWAYWQS